MSCEFGVKIHRRPTTHRMRACSLCRGLLGALLIVLTPHARAQDASIDELLKKLPSPEELGEVCGRQGAATTRPGVERSVGPGNLLALQAQNFPRAGGPVTRTARALPEGCGRPLHERRHSNRCWTNRRSFFSLRKAISLRPDLAVAYFMLGNLEIRQQHYDAALPHLQKAAELEPKNPIALVFLSQCYAKLGRG